MRKTTFLYGAAMLGTAWLGMASVGAQAAPTPPVLRNASPATAWAKSVKITAVKVPETDISDLLGLSMWRINVVGPKPAHELKLILETQEKGKPPHSLVEYNLNPTGGWPLNNSLSVSVGQYPLYDNLGVSTKTKYQIGVSGFRYSSQFERGNSASSGVYNNPLSGMSIASSDAPEQRPDGSFVLSCGTKTHFPMESPGDVAIVFRVEEVAH